MTTFETIQYAVYRFKRMDIEPTLITMHPETLWQLINDNAGMGNTSRDAKGYKIMGIKVARSLDVEPGDIYVA